jgi:glutamyl-tRNA reductase
MGLQGYFCPLLNMEQTFKALILTYKTVPLQIREMVSLQEQGAKRLFQFIREYTSATDVLIVSTCNRTELYYRAEKDYSQEILQGLKLIKQIDQPFEHYFKKISDKEAVQHLFEVAIGLDAQIIGDLQISGQVKTAYQWSADENMAGTFLHRLLHTIFFVNKRVVQETSFRDGAASISYAAKELAEDLTIGIKEPKILVVGVGEIGQDVCLNLSDAGVKNVTIVNRSIEKAEKLAIKCGFKFGGIEILEDELAKADVVISSVSVNQPIITPDLLQRTTVLSHKYFIDLSVPRSVDPAVENIPGVVLYNMDDLQEKTNAALEKRLAAIPQVQHIIEQTIAEFSEWSKEMVVSPTIQKLKQALEQIRKEELARYLKSASPQEAEKLDELSKSLVQKILKYPVLQLKAACKRGEAETLSELLQELFNLEKTPKKV